MTAGRADERPLVLLFFRYFNPDYEASGPTQSLLRMIAALSESFRFRVVSVALPHEAAGTWQEVLGVERMALRRGLGGLADLRRLLRRGAHELAVLNSFFDPLLTIATLAMRKLRLIPRRPVLLAPRGEFSPGALAINAGRKSAYLGVARRLGLADDLHIQATNEAEAEAIRAALPNAPSILIGPNIRTLEPIPAHPRRVPGSPLRIAFLSRIDIKKNLDLAIRLLGSSGARAGFDVIGPVTNAGYWAKCESMLAGLPSTVTARYVGQVDPGEIVATLAEYDLMLLPTAGENYGHVIVDSLLAGTPVLISDRTPWRGLADARAGADLPLDDEASWLDWIRRFEAMGDPELGAWRAGARAYVERALSDGDDREMVAQCLARAIAEIP